jgi:hypothetical protein
MKIQEVLLENAERPYVCVHAKKGKHECTASSSYEAVKKAAEKWGLKSTAGIDAHLADVKHTATNEAYDPFAVDGEEDEYMDTPNTKVKNIIAQLEQAQDFEGNKAISFENGDQKKLPLKVIEMFLTAYGSVKDKQQMSTDASASLEGFIAAVKDSVAGKYGKAQKGTYYGMSGSNPNKGGPTYYN